MREFVMRDFVMRELVYEILFARFCLRDIHRKPANTYTCTVGAKYCA